MKVLAKEDFYSAVAELLKLYREGDLFGLANSPLLQTPLFTEMLLLDEPFSLTNSRELVEAVLSWGIHELTPSGQQDWYNKFWRHYNLLNAFYLDGMTVAEIAERMGIAEQTFYEWRSASVSALAQLLYQECYHPSDLFGCQQQLIQQRYEQLSAEEKTTLALVSVSSSPLPLRPLFNPEEINHLRKLHEKYLLVLLPSEVTQPDLLRRHIDQLLPEERRVAAHKSLTDKFGQAGLFQSAVLHAYEGGQIEEAIRLAVTKEEVLFKQADVEALYTLFGKIVSLSSQQTGIALDLWSEFLMVAAKTAKWVGEQDLALNYSRQALSAPDIEIKIKAYYQRAKLLSRVNLDACLSHYAVCLDLMERSGRLETGEVNLRRLATRMLIDRAWIFIQERPNYENADRDLNRAEALIPAADSALWCDLYNARAGLVARSQSAEKAMPLRLQALTSAEESGDIERMTKMAYNVGIDYVFAGDYENGRVYLSRSLDWAQESGNLQTLGLAHKGLGGCCFFTEAYEEAISHYEKAYEIWCHTNNKNWQVYITYDLVEAYATIGRFLEARQQFEIGMQLAKELGNERMLAELDELSQRFSTLQFSLGARQAEALAYVDVRGSITRQEYVALTGVAKSQAYRDLDEMCQIGLLTRVGKGRGTRYVRA